MPEVNKNNQSDRTKRNLKNADHPTLSFNGGSGRLNKMPAGFLGQHLYVVAWQLHEDRKPTDSQSASSSKN